MMMVKLRGSWFLTTLVGRLTTLCVTLLIVLGVASGVIVSLSIALSASHQSQAICKLAYDLGTGEPSAQTTPLGLGFIMDGRNAFRHADCQNIMHSLPPLTPAQVQYLPAGTK